MTVFINDFTAYSSTQTSLDTKIKRAAIAARILFQLPYWGEKEPISLLGDFHVHLDPQLLSRTEAVGPAELGLCRLKFALSDNAVRQSAA